MRKISVKDLVDFRRKSERSKNTFAKNLKVEKEKIKTDGGGDYWVISLSAISNSFRNNTLEPIAEKLIELNVKNGKKVIKQTKDMYLRNASILANYENFDLKRWRPSKELIFQRKHKQDSVLSVKGLPIQVTPHHIFSFEKNGKVEIGAIWFIAKLNGFKKEELGMFTDILYRYLKSHYSKTHTLNPRYCIAVDVVNKLEVNYAQIKKKEVPAFLNVTLQDLKNLIHTKKTYG